MLKLSHKRYSIFWFRPVTQGAHPPEHAGRLLVEQRQCQPIELDPPRLAHHTGRAWTGYLYSLRYITNYIRSSSKPRTKTKWRGSRRRQGCHTFNQLAIGQLKIVVHQVDAELAKDQQASSGLNAHDMRNVEDSFDHGRRARGNVARADTCLRGTNRPNPRQLPSLQNRWR